MHVNHINDPWDMLNNFCFHVYAQKWVFVIMSHVTFCISHVTCHIAHVTCHISNAYARIQLPILPKISENKTCSQNFDHEGIKFHQPIFFQTSSDMSSWISESFINIGRYLDMELIFWMKLVPPKKRTKIGHFSSTFFVFAKFSGRRSCRWVFKLFLGRLRLVIMNFWNCQLPMSILSTLSEFLKIKK